jgi:hypothetical protein
VHEGRTAHEGRARRKALRNVTKEWHDVRSTELKGTQKVHEGSGTKGSPTMPFMSRERNQCTLFSLSNFTSNSLSNFTK